MALLLLSSGIDKKAKMRNTVLSWGRSNSRCCGLCLEQLSHGMPLRWVGSRNKSLKCSGTTSVGSNPTGPTIECAAAQGVSRRGRSSMGERGLYKPKVEGSSPFASTPIPKGSWEAHTKRESSLRFKPHVCASLRPQHWQDKDT